MEKKVAENLKKVVKNFLINHFPPLAGRATLSVVLVKFRETLSDQEAKDHITEAIKELNYESKL